MKKKGFDMYIYQNQMLNNKKISCAPLRLLIIIISSVIFVEGSLLFLSNVLHPASIQMWTVFNAALLPVVLFPALYCFSFLPLIRHFAERTCNEETKLKLAEDAFKRSEEKLDAILQSIGDHMGMIDKDLNIIWVNDFAKKTFGSDITGKKCYTVYHKRTEPCEPFPCFALRAFQDGNIHTLDNSLVSRDNKTIYFHCTANAAVRDKDGNPTGVLVISRDTTESKKLEQQLIQAQKMEAVGQLAGGIAHDFNNILTAIIGYGSLLQMEKSKDDPLNNYVEHILHSAQRAANLTQALLAFSRKQVISPKPVNVNEIIMVLKRLLSGLIGEDVELATILTDKDLSVMVDPTQMEQVLMNLATNARDAMPDGGNLIISTDIVRIDEAFINSHGYGRNGNFALISVEDTGLGINSKTKERIFEPFFTTKEVGKGTGLGLAAVYGIITQHDGYIDVSSETGKGTIFKIYLPLIRTKTEDEETEAFPEFRGNAGTVLIAEDDAQAYAQVTSAADGAGRARALAQASEPPLAIAECAAELAEAGAETARAGTWAFRADAVVASELAAAAALGGAELVATNLVGDSGDPRTARARAAADRARRASDAAATPASD